MELGEGPGGPGSVGLQAKREFPARAAAELVALTVAYVVSARLGLRLDAVSGFATLVWAPSGIALAALLLGGSRLWPGVAAGAIVANVLTGAPLWVALGIGTGNTLEAVLAASLLRRMHFEVRLERLRDVLALIVVGAGLSTLVSATIGLRTLQAGGIVLPGHLLQTWRAWWLGDALGDLVVAPFLFTWIGSWQPGTVNPRRLIEGVVLAVVTIGVSRFIFRLGAPLDPTPFRQAYMLFPVLIWAAIRFGPRGATATMLLSSAIAIWGTFLAHGPFAHPDVSQSLFRLQAFMAVAAVTILVLAAALAERNEALEVREELLTIVSHDLKNPLGAIQMSTRELLVQSEPGSSARRSAEIVDRSARRMKALITRLLDTATIRAGRLALERAPHDLASLVKEAAETIQPLLEQKSQDLRVDVPANLSVNVDRERILQVFSNLFGNAVKFTPPNGSIRAQVVVVDGWAHCSVTDSGPGIEPDELERVFEPYWKGQTTEGTGLGLSIVKGIIEAHGGTTSARSKGGAGTTIAFTLPLARSG